MPMTTVSSPRPAITRCCMRSGRRRPTPTPRSVPSRTVPTLMKVPVNTGRGEWQAVAPDVLIVSLGTTTGLRTADAALEGSLQRAGATTALSRITLPSRLPPTLPAQDFVLARAARRAVSDARAVVYSSTTAALLAITYGTNPAKKGLDRVLGAWALARREGETLLVLGGPRVDAPGVRWQPLASAPQWRELLRRASVYVTAPRREDYGLAQLDA